MIVVGLNRDVQVVAKANCIAPDQLRQLVVKDLDDCDYIGVMSEEIWNAFDCWSETIKAAPSAVALLVILVPYKPPPQYDMRHDGAVDSFVVSRVLLERVLDKGEVDGFALLSFKVVTTFIGDHDFGTHLLVRQVGQWKMERVAATSCSKAEGISVIIPHRGSIIHLREALTSLHSQIITGDIDIHVGLDGNIPTEPTIKNHLRRGIEMLRFNPSPVGPYVIRQYFINRSSSRYMALQDSDDYSCSDRLESSIKELARLNLDIVGCHELQLDEIRRCVTIHRFPLDVNHALEIDGRGGLLHPTMVADRARVLSAGGLSTNLRYASDTQFKLRSYFILRMGNVDEFLYLRRRHPACLTIDPHTRLGSPTRERLRALWQQDFELVKAGKKHLHESSLAPIHRDGTVSIERAFDGAKAHENVHQWQPKQTMKARFLLPMA